jgi:pyruvate/2-oxoglutarate dehydrogenase complex dihydrolipoamide acyltransferase (E2) component
MPLFRRCDGELVKDIDPLRRMMPLVIRGRNESIVYHTTQWEIAKARAWLRNYNRTRGGRPRATLFHLVAYASIRMLHARPGLNRFVSGGAIYQRKGVWLSFAAKTRFTDEAPLTTVKLGFSEKEQFDECVDRMDDAVKDGRCGLESRIEREVRLLNKLPGPLLRAILAAGRGLDRVNLLPASLIEPDPMYASMFLANLGSIHIGNAYHHLYEYGTCSLFGVVGGVKKVVVAGRSGHPEVREVLQVQWSFDERVNDGFYCVQSLEILRRVMEDPQRHVEGEDERVFAGSENPLVPADIPS